MAPLTQGIKTTYSHTTDTGGSVYNGNFDSEFGFGPMVHGGIIISTILSAALSHQSRTSSPHIDPMNLSAEFLSPPHFGPAEIHITPFVVASRSTRLDVGVWQGGRLCTRAHVLFSVMPSLTAPKKPSSDSMTLLPHTPSPFAPTLPRAFKHPSEGRKMALPFHHNFEKRVKVTEMDSRENEEGKVSWATWLELEDEGEDVTTNPATMGFFSDMFANGPEVLLAAQGDDVPTNLWYPTVSFNLTFLSKFPLLPTPSLTISAGTPIAKRTVGIYAVTKFMSEGRHDETVEVWSAPCGIGEECGWEVGSEEWRKEAQILCVSRQTALTIPALSEDKLEARKGASKL